MSLSDFLDALFGDGSQRQLQPGERYEPEGDAPVHQYAPPVKPHYFTESGGRPKESVQDIIRRLDERQAENERESREYMAFVQQQAQRGGRVERQSEAGYNAPREMPAPTIFEKMLHHNQVCTWRIGPNGQGEFFWVDMGMEDENE